MQYNDSSNDVSRTGIKPDVVFLKTTLSRSVDFNRVISKICDKSMMGVTVEWKGGKAFLKGPIESLLGYCMRNGIVQNEMTTSADGIKYVFFYKYNWVDGQEEEMKQFLFKALL